MKRAIIIVPGISGSKLYAADNFFYGNKMIKAGTLLWIKPSVFDVIDGDMNNQIRALSCTKEGIPEHPTECADIAKNEYGTIDTYEDLTNYLRKAYKSVYDVIFFSYDWRLPCSESAKHLEEYVRYKKYERIVLVAHSMGGLVCTSYIKNGNKDRVEKLITLGTPHLGTPMSLYIFETGCFFDSIADRIFNDSIQTVCENFRSVYELLPSRQYFDFGKDHYVQKKIGNNTMTLNSYEDTCNLLIRRDWCKQKNLLNDAGLFMDGLYASGALNNDNLYCICGTKVSTIREITMRYDATGNFVGIGDLKMGNGDGTVVLHSANNNAKMKNIYVAKNITHSGLIKSKEIFSVVKSMIDGVYRRKPEHTSEYEPPESFLKVEFDQPVNIEIKEKSGQSMHEPIYRTGGRLDNRMVFLPPGEYDIKVRGKGYNCRVSHDGCTNGVCSKVNLYRDDNSFISGYDSSSSGLVESMSLKD